MKATLAFLVLLHPSAALAAVEPTAVARVSKTEVSVGEQFMVEVRATGPAGTTFAFPGDASQEAFELHSAPAGPSPLPAGTHLYQAQVFALGEAQVPAFPIQYRLPDGTTGVAKSAPIALKVASLLPKDKGEQKLADVRGPVPVSIGRAFWIGLIAVTALGAALVWWVLLRRRRAAPVDTVSVPGLEPDDEARRALAALVASGRLARGEHRPFYIDLTMIAKRYLERRLEAPIVEMTTAEMLTHLRATPGSADLVPTVRDLAGAADQIKFACGRGLTEEAERHLSATRAMVETLEARLQPLAPEGGKAA